MVSRGGQWGQGKCSLKQHTYLNTSFVFSDTGKQTLEYTKKKKKKERKKITNALGRGGSRALDFP